MAMNSIVRNKESQNMTDQELSLQKDAQVGSPFGTVEDFVEVPFTEASTQYKDYFHACHGLFYAMDHDRFLWNRQEAEVKARIMMQFRFDGNLGFPGGLMDKGPETPVEALNRELVEEIHLDVKKISFTQDDHLVSHVNQKKQLVTHFYTKHLSLEQYDEVERRTIDAHDWGVETAGIARVPLYTMHDGYRGLPVFLANRFAGNARGQLLLALKRLAILTEHQIETAYQASLELLRQTLAG